MVRLFVAVELPAAIRQRLAGLVWPIAGARWVAMENLHLTLRFIGEVDEGCAADIDGELARIEFDAFSFDLAGAGHFGSGNGARALWAGVAACQALLGLQAKIERAVVRAGAAPERRKFHPHVTLARLRRGGGARVEQFVVEHGGLAMGPIEVASFALISSRLGRGGADYTAEVRYPLNGGLADLDHVWAGALER